MTQRSTRNKVRLQAAQAALKIDAILRHLMYIDELAGEKSEYINLCLPVLVESVQLLQDALTQFRSGL